MKITYDSEADALYISLRKASAADAIDIEEGAVADLDGEGHVIGFEILDAQAPQQDGTVRALYRQPGLRTDGDRQAPRLRTTLT